MILELGPAPPIHGRDGIVDHYCKMLREVRKDLNVNRFIADDDGIGAEFTARFIAIKDARDCKEITLNRLNPSTLRRRKTIWQLKMKN